MNFILGIVLFNLATIYYGFLFCDKKKYYWFFIPFSYWIVKLFRK